MSLQGAFSLSPLAKYYNSFSSQLKQKKYESDKYSSS